MPIATGVAWFHDCKGGEFAFFPNGAGAPAVAHEVAFNTALLLDADSVFHGVDRIASVADEMAPLKPGMRLHFVSDDRWVVRDENREVVRYSWDELRFSVSWKAYCFKDEDEQRSWRQHADDLTLDLVVDRMVDDLRTRGRIGRDVPGHPDLALSIIDEYIRFPNP